VTHRNKDPFDPIRQGDPAPRDQMPDAHSPFGRAVRDRALATSREPHLLRTRRRSVARAILVIGLAMAVAAAAWLVTREASEPRGVGCYEEPTLDGKVVVVAAPTQLLAEVCEPLWADGTLRNPSIINPFEIPRLISCVNDVGGLAVFPGDHPRLCQELGLASHEPSQPDDDPATSLNQQLLSIFANSRCLPVEDARSQVEALFTSENLIGWTVSVTAPASTERPCASFALDAPNQTVRLVPIPEPPPGN